MTTESGAEPEPEDGEAIVYVDGNPTSVKTTSLAGRVEVELSNGIRIAFSAQSPAGAALAVGKNGVLELSPSDSIRVVASGFGGAVPYGMVMFSEPVSLARGTTTEDGSVDASATLPGTIGSGRHTLQVNTFDPAGKVVSVSTPVDVAGDGNSAFGRVVLVVLVIALAVAIVIPASMRRRRA